jgi:hypothetical protein
MQVTEVADMADIVGLKVREIEFVVTRLGLEYEKKFWVLDDVEMSMI